MEERQLVIDDGSPVPVYAQLCEQMRSAIFRGEVAPGEQLPSVRDVAARLGINPNTVNRAYAELERDGAVETRRGRGTYALAPRVRRAVRGRPRLMDIAEPFVARARALGYAGSQIVNTVASIVRRSA